MGPQGESARKEGGILGFGIEACNRAEGTSGKLRNGVALGMGVAVGNEEGAIGRVRLILGLGE